MLEFSSAITPAKQALNVPQRIATMCAPMQYESTVLFSPNCETKAERMTLVELRFWVQGGTCENSAKPDVGGC
jgi:hypothetical protein